MREYFAYTPRPEIGQPVSGRKCKKLNLPGERWDKVLRLMAESPDGRTATKADLITSLGYMKTKPGCDLLPSEQARHEEKLREEASKALKKLSDTMADLSRDLRKELSQTNTKQKVFESRGDEYCTPFPIRCILDNHEGNPTFG